MWKLEGFLFFKMSHSNKHTKWETRQKTVRIWHFRNCLFKGDLSFVHSSLLIRLRHWRQSELIVGEGGVYCTLRCTLDGYPAYHRADLQSLTTSHIHTHNWGGGGGLKSSARLWIVGGSGIIQSKLMQNMQTQHWEAFTLQKKWSAQSMEPLSALSIISLQCQICL